MYGNIKLTGILFKRNVIVAPGFDGGVEQFDFRMSPGSYRSRSVNKVGGECGNSAKKKQRIFYGGKVMNMYFKWILWK